MSRSWRLDSGGATLALLAEDDAPPEVIHFGAFLPSDVSIERLAAAGRFARANAEPDQRVPIDIAPSHGFGFFGAPAIRGSRAGGRDFVQRFTLADAQKPAAHRFACRLIDPVAGLELGVEWRLDGAVLSARTSVVNRGEGVFRLDWLASLTLPLDQRFSEALTFEGRWAQEFREARTALPSGTLERVSRRGKPGQGQAPQIVIGEAGFSDDHGALFGAALAWSGDFRILVETLETGERQLQLGAWLAPGAVELGEGERFETPWAHAAFSDTGLDGLSGRLHGFFRDEIAPANARRPRLVHLNSWEALYFDHERQKLFDLVDQAVALGVERFVLDDGWFGVREDDTTSLGDWRVDERRHPGGLDPLIARVRAEGMSFGLWVEPEMISEDSDLYRAHPEWALAAAGRARPTERRQLVLDLAQSAVRDHLFDVLHTLLRRHAIDYLKWDHNRALFPAAGGERPSSLDQTLGFYELVDRLRAAHPEIEIESCAGGGGRVDYAVMRRAERFWTSDQNDALERRTIQRGASIFFPLAAMGAHVGPSPSHQTGRRLSLGFRAAIALFGHFGIECDPRALSDVERAELAIWVGHYKTHRALLHRGRLKRFRIDDEGTARGQIVVAPDGGEALAQLTQSATSRWTDPPRARLPGLDPSALYRIKALEPAHAASLGRLAAPALWFSGELVLDGVAIGKRGLALPLTLPESYWILHLQRVDEGQP